MTVALVGVAGHSVGRAARSDKWWWDNLGGPDSSNFMKLDQINKSNVARLEVAWFYPHATTVFNPVAVDDVIYTYGRGSSLIALDATTGKEIWIHEGLPGINARGINYWQSSDGKDKRLLFSVNSFLQAIDAKTGKSILTFGNNGIVDLREGLLRAEGTGINVQSGSPGKVWRNLLILGSAPGEGFISPPGDIRAYDVVTGRKVWQFHTVPQPGEFGYETWPKDAYKYVGGSNNWGSMSVDDERGIVYIPTGSATYDFYGADRHGANLFSNCLLALDTRTGRRLWHFQTIHHDIWDLDNVSAPQLVTIRNNGRRVDVVALAGKTGFLYVFDRVTGQPIWPIEERPVPQTDVPGEMTWPTQPYVTKPAPFARQTFTVDDVNPWLLTPQAYEEIKARVAKAHVGPGPQGGLFIPTRVGEDSISMPGNMGGSNWGTTAANPEKGLVFVLNMEAVSILRLEDVKTRGVALSGNAANQGAVPQGRAVYMQNCQVCHGANLQGAVPGAPSLVGVTSRLSDDAIRAVVTGGRGLMRPVSDVTADQLTQVIAYLASTNPMGRGIGAASAAPGFPPGPIVARGGAPQPPLPARGVGPFFPGVGGNAGNLPYPDEVRDIVPQDRYMSEYAVMSAATKPPYTTLTAYDLNTGEIKWQVPTGDHPPTIAAGGPRNTGGLALRTGIMPTKAGIVFEAGGDGKLRAYDEDTGKILWMGDFAGQSRGVPVMYESKGRQYLVIAAVAGGAPAAPGQPAVQELPPGTPIGHIAWALPRR
ncbi:MAG: PQQ-binding-like beta-propeller repeat protein [Acidobacteria bacterium]|nr:PQQ-binding-like beta-propeller repeat protein [Acidobacteriota bacterium]